jgi:hypothetical protein
MLQAAVHGSGLIYVDLTSSPHVRILYVALLAFFLYCDDDQLGLFSGFPFLNLHVNQCHFLSSYSYFAMHGVVCQTKGIGQTRQIANQEHIV